mmetsp:Transcript_39005/g.90773  ORF Transcript_39005/g.90773 Transcript_39005/m.90773 type:complete len:87 (-) Transcript_39005:415-675(-)
MPAPTTIINTQAPPIIEKVIVIGVIFESSSILVPSSEGGFDSDKDGASERSEEGTEVGLSVGCREGGAVQKLPFDPSNIAYVPSTL